MKKRHRHNQCECCPGGDDSHRVCSTSELGFAHLETSLLVQFVTRTRALYLKVPHLHCKYIYSLSENRQRGQRFSVPRQSPGASEESPFLQKPTPAHRACMHSREWACEPSWHTHRLQVVLRPIWIPRSPCPRLLGVHILYHPADYKPDTPHLRGKGERQGVHTVCLTVATSSGS